MLPIALLFDPISPFQCVEYSSIWETGPAVSNGQLKVLSLVSPSIYTLTEVLQKISYTVGYEKIARV